PRLRELRDHLAQRGVLAADPLDVGHPEPIEIQHALETGHGRPSYRLKDLVETAILHFMHDRRRTVFFVSDGTGITVEMLRHSLLTQFDGVDSTDETIPFVDSVDKARACVERINSAPRPAGLRPVAFTTLVNADIRETVRKADAFVLDFFESFLDPLEAEFGSKSTHTIGRSHSARDAKGYTHRIEAINFALAHDDGASARDLDKADVILVGVSRSGKTPTSL